MNLKTEQMHQTTHWSVMTGHSVNMQVLCVAFLSQYMNGSQQHNYKHCNLSWEGQRRRGKSSLHLGGILDREAAVQPIEGTGGEWTSSKNELQVKFISRYVSLKQRTSDTVVASIKHVQENLFEDDLQRLDLEVLCPVSCILFPSLLIQLWSNKWMQNYSAGSEDCQVLQWI